MFAYAYQEALPLVLAYINAMITGSGTACDDKNIQIPRNVAGLGGGGG